MPLAQSDEVTRQFEAISDDPKNSIEQVVVEVLGRLVEPEMGLLVEYS